MISGKQIKLLKRITNALEQWRRHEKIDDDYPTEQVIEVFAFMVGMLLANFDEPKELTRIVSLSVVQGTRVMEAFMEAEEEEDNDAASSH